MQDISTITHSKAVSAKLVDRYLLRELSAAEAEEFERHYFECSECAEAVEVGDVLIANAREVLHEMPAMEGESSFLQRLGIRWTWGGLLMPATAFALAIIAVYQGAVVIPQLRQPRVLPAFQLLGATRGQEDARVVPREAPVFALNADLPPDAHAARYVCDLKSGGRTLFTLEAAPPAPGQPLSILFPTKGLQSGEYELIIRGGSERVFDSVFGLRFQ